MSIFEKWDSKINGQAMAKDVAEIEKNGERQYVDVPCGLYDVSIKKMELKLSKKGDPMFSCQFKINAGEFKGQYIFMNQLVVLPMAIHIVDEFLRNLDTDVEVEFTGKYSDYEKLILDVFEQVSEKLEYSLDYSEDSKGYKHFEIKDVFELE